MVGNFPDVTRGFRCWAAPENTHKRLILGFLSVTHHHHLPSTPHTCYRIGMNCGDDVDDSALGNGLLVIIYAASRVQFASWWWEGLIAVVSQLICSPLCFWWRRKLHCFFVRKHGTSGRFPFLGKFRPHPGIYSPRICIPGLPWAGVVGSVAPPAGVLLLAHFLEEKHVASPVLPGSF